MPAAITGCAKWWSAAALIRRNFLGICTEIILI